jgi:post-segregation antitoxin (ccd killing protein)
MTQTAETDVITVRVTKSLKAKARKHKIDISKTMREALEDEVKKREDAEFLQNLTKLKAFLQTIPEENIVRAIRESRDQR